MVENWQRGGFGIYVHWPYCATKCPYCDFNSHVAARVDHEDWRRAYRAEIARYGTEFPGRVVSSVFFGGGTPSLMDPSVVGDILDDIAKIWPLSNDIEITLEANPTSVESSRFQAFRAAGINRVSIGVQALNDRDLKRLGRAHSVKEALQAIEIGRAEFDRVSFDLIYARQNQSMSDWTAELSTALAMEPDHLSLYQLTIEDGTVFADRHRRGKLTGLPSDDLGADLYDLTQTLCEATGLPAYETSNHARPGAESRHNLIYWRAGDYLGVGPGAHGRITVDGARFATETTLLPADWLAAVEQGSGEARRERLSDGEAAQEALLMGLRLSEGISRTRDINRILSRDGLDHMRSLEFLSVSDTALRVTPAGRPILNALLDHITQDVA